MTEFSPDIRWERIATNLRVERELLETLELLKGLPVVVFKGPILTRQIYGELSSRASADNDLWVPSKHTVEALERLVGAGYESWEYVDLRRALARDGQVTLWARGDLDRVSVDLHEYPFSARYFSVDESILMGNLETIRLHGQEILTFSRPLALLHMIAHYVQHHFEDAQLEHIGAAWDAWSSELAETQLRELARCTCSEPALEMVLARCFSKGHCGVPPVDVHSSRARAVEWAFASGCFEHSLARKFLSLLLVNPRRLPKAVVGSVLLERDDLHSRYGGGAPWRLYTRHLKYLLER